MKKILAVTLAIVTSVGGFLEIGSIATAAQGGADFRFQLAWAIALGTLCLILLVEMSGRLALMSKQTLIDAIRSRLGFRTFVVLLVLLGGVTFLVLVAEIGGVCLALQAVTGITYRLWAIPVALLLWLLLWRGTFGLIENGTSLLGLVTIAFGVAAVKMHPDWSTIAASLVPTRPSHAAAHYWFLVVSILGASISPYLLVFYSSGAIEDKWDTSYVVANRAIATIGMTFGGVLSIAVLIVAATVLAPHGIRVDHFQQMVPMLMPALGRAGIGLFAGSVGIACFGAAAELALAIAYMFAQGLGWEWGEDLPPTRDSRFTTTYTLTIVLAPWLLVAGVDPLSLTVASMALTAATLPISVVPFLVIMNDKSYLGDRTNRWPTNVIVGAIALLALGLAVVSIPLEVLGG